MRKESEQIIEKEQREKKIKQEINRLKKLYKEFEVTKKKTLEGLIQNAAFMKIHLDELMEGLINEGLIVIFKQGKQVMKIKNQKFDIYNSMVKKYAAVMKQLIDLIPEEKKQDENSALLEYLKKGAAIKK